MWEEEERRTETSECPRLLGMFCFARLSRTRLAAMVAPALVTVTRPQAVDPNAPTPAHHQKGGGYVNPWESFKAVPVTPSSLLNAYKDWTSKPVSMARCADPRARTDDGRRGQVPPPEELPQVVTPDWGLAASATAQDKEAWKADVKGTWLGHACFLVEFPTLPGTEGRGARVLFDPVFSQRCSPSQWVGPKRVTNPPFKLEELPHVDCVVISHNHVRPSSPHSELSILIKLHDDISTTTLMSRLSSTSTSPKRRAAYTSSSPSVTPSGSPRSASPLSTSARWIGGRSATSPSSSRLDLHTFVFLHYLRNTLRVARFTIDSIPCGLRGLFDNSPRLPPRSEAQSGSEETLDTRLVRRPSFLPYLTLTRIGVVPRGATTEVGLPVCPAFKEIGDKVGPFDLSMIPIGAYDPRYVLSPSLSINADEWG